MRCCARQKKPVRRGGGHGDQIAPPAIAAPGRRGARFVPDSSMQHAQSARTTPAVGAAAEPEEPRHDRTRHVGVSDASCSATDRPAGRVQPASHSRRSCLARPADRGPDLRVGAGDAQQRIETPGSAWMTRSGVSGQRRRRPRTVDVGVGRRHGRRGPEGLPNAAVGQPDADQTRGGPSTARAPGARAFSRTGRCGAEADRRPRQAGRRSRPRSRSPRPRSGRPRVGIRRQPSVAPRQRTAVAEQGAARRDVALDVELGARVPPRRRTHRDPARHGSGIVRMSGSSPRARGAPSPTTSAFRRWPETRRARGVIDADRRQPSIGASRWIPFITARSTIANPLVPTPGQRVGVAGTARSARGR
jgi:hypothetical protein